jgi:DNA-binding NarL/FixJ family response regulator
VPLATFVVEDNLTIRSHLVEAMAELADIEIVGFAEAAEQAIAALKQCRWQLAVVDLFLREGSGLSVLGSFRDRGPDRRMVMLTNYATDEMRRRCLELGADAVFDKSTELDAFFDFCCKPEKR